MAFRGSGVRIPSAPPIPPAPPRAPQGTCPPKGQTLVISPATRLSATFYQHSSRLLRLFLSLPGTVCQNDLEGMIAKWKYGRYDQPGWFKTKSPVQPDSGKRQEIRSAPQVSEIELSPSVSNRIR
jgi:hypothetical protein